MTPSVQARRRSCAPQRGVATIFVTIVLLLAVALISLYTINSAVMEQRLSANQVRAKQALAAANAGLDHALAYIRNGGLDHSNAGTVDTVTSNTLTSSSGTASYYKVAYRKSTESPTVSCPSAHTDSFSSDTTITDLTKVSAVACGWSDDDSAVQRIVQLLSATPATGGSISTPVITKGTTNLLTGGASVLNYFNDLTVWSGGSLLGQSNTGKTFIRDVATNPTASTSDNYRNTGNSPACNNPPVGYECSTQGSTLGHDTVGGDTNLSSLSAAGFFQYFMGQTPTNYRDNVATWVVDLNSTLTGENATSISSITNMTNNVIWVEGSTSLPGNVGTQAKPVVLVINGDLDLGSNIEINGLVFVTGNITGNGSPTVYGALVGAGSASANGNLKVIYDPSVLGAAANLGKAAKLQGSWRDW